MEGLFFSDINDLVYAAVCEVVSGGVITSFVEECVVDIEKEIPEWEYKDFHDAPTWLKSELEEQCWDILDPYQEYTLFGYEDGSYEFELDEK